MGPVARVRVFLDRLFAARSAAGPYRFVVRRWRRLSDIRIAEAIVTAESHRLEAEITALPLEGVDRVVVIAPHQDDESIGPGGTLLHLRRAGAAIDMIFTTDGAQTRADLDPAEVVKVRDAESAAVASRLGADIHRLGISNVELDARPDHVRKLADLLRRLSPKVILTPWLLDRPPKHRLSNYLLALATRQAEIPETEVWGYQVHNGIFANAYVDITEVSEEKRDLIRVYRSQNEKYVRYDHIALGLNAWNTHLLPGTAQDPRERYIEAFHTLPVPEFRRLVERWYRVDPRVTYQGEESAIRAAARLGR